MIRAVDKSNNTFVYVYYIYEAMDFSENRICKYYLCSIQNYTGLIAMKESDLHSIELDNNSYILLKNLDSSAGKNDLIHPILYEFLEHDWEVYEGIVEGNPDDYYKFEKKLGHRP